MNRNIRRRISTGTLWIGPCAGVDDGSCERYREEGSEEFSVSSGYHQCQYRVTARGELVNTRHQ